MRTDQMNVQAQQPRRRFPRRRFRGLVLLMGLWMVFGLSACGNKGPLTKPAPKTVATVVESFTAPLHRDGY